MADQNGQRGCSRPTRRGQSTAAVIATLSVLGGVGAATIYFVPSAIEARSTSDQHVVAAADPDHQRVIEALAGILARSARIIAVHRDPLSETTDIVLWLEAEDRDHGPQPGELVVMRHSPIMQTVALHHAAGLDDENLDAWRPWIAENRLDTPAFARAWRQDPAIHRQILATGVGAFEIAELEQSDDPASPGHAKLKLSLIWPADSTDASDRASVVVQVMRGAGRLAE